MASRTADSTLSLQIRRTLPATPERVFRAWTEADEMKRWYAPAEAIVEEATSDPRVGGRYHVHMRGTNGASYRVSGTYREVEPPRRLVFTWRWESDPPERESLVAIELFDREGATEMVLTHSRFVTERERDGHGVGWETCLDRLSAEMSRGSGGA